MTADFMGNSETPRGVPLCMRDPQKANPAQEPGLAASGGAALVLARAHASDRVSR